MFSIFGIKLPQETEEIEAPLQYMQFRLKPKVSSYAIGLDAFVLAKKT